MDRTHTIAVIAASLFLATAAGLSAQTTGGAADVGRHSMTGEVSSIDAKDGWVHVKTAEGTMVVRFPPSALASLKKGDRVSVDLALKSNAPQPR